MIVSRWDRGCNTYYYFYLSSMNSSASKRHLNQNIPLCAQPLFLIYDNNYVVVFTARQSNNLTHCQECVFLNIVCKHRIGVIWDNIFKRLTKKGSPSNSTE